MLVVPCGMVVLGKQHIKDCRLPVHQCGFSVAAKPCNLSQKLVCMLWDLNEIKSNIDSRLQYFTSHDACTS